MQPTGGENQPQIEFSPPSAGEAETAAVPEKIPAASPENSPQKQPQQVASQVASDLALPATAIATTDNQASQTVAPAEPSSGAGDSDRIEKEWIDQVKAVAAKTKDDPFEQKNAMSKVKADYIQKRFNKTVKTDDTVR